MCESTRESGESSLNRQIKRRLKRTIFYSLFEEAKAYAFFLRSWRRGSFAQEGEDRFLLEYFGSKTGIYVDVGANHPFVISNTYLLYRRGWRGLTVEPLPHLARKHVFWRPRDICVNAGVDERIGRLHLHQFAPSALSTFDGEQAKHLVESGSMLVRTLDVEVLTLTGIWTRYADSLKKVDLLCVDTEGMDLRVLRSNDFEKLKPKLILCETPAKSSGLDDLQRLLAKYGYRQLRTIGCNTFFENSKN